MNCQACRVFVMLLCVFALAAPAVAQETGETSAADSVDPDTVSTAAESGQQAETEDTPKQEAEEAEKASAQERKLEELIVTATRAPKSEKAIPNQVTSLDAVEIEVQQSLSLDPGDMLAKMLPSYTPPQQKLGGASESLRGREPLYLIDGVPQSNPLRNGSRDGFTIDMGAVERIEVIYGANAIQGLGATGGIINFITLSAPDDGEVRQNVELGLTTGDNFDSDGLGYRALYNIGARSGAWDGVAAVAYESRGIFFDAEGRTVGIEPTQGDIADSTSWNVFLKGGYEPDENQRIQLMINTFSLEGDGNYIDLEGDREAGIPTTSIPGRELGAMAANDVTTVSLSYINAAFLGGEFTAQAYYQDFAATYGGGSYAVFQDPLIAPIGDLFDQSQNQSEKIGLRLTQRYDDIFNWPAYLIFGADVLKDETRQTLIQTGRDWVPLTEYQGISPFVQMSLDAAEWLTVVGGVRYEMADLKVDDYTSIAGNRRRIDYARTEVNGGSPSFTEPLFNIGAVTHPADTMNVYAAFTQGFGMPDVGRVLRAVAVPDVDIDDFLLLQPLVTDNFEIGFEYAPSWGSLKLAWYDSSSDYGRRLALNDEGFYDVKREKTEIGGWEGIFSAYPYGWLGITVGYSRITGEYDSDGDGTVDTDLGAIDVGPDRFNLAFSFDLGGTWKGRLQSFTYFDKTFRDSDGSVSAEFDGYTVVDALASVELGPSMLSFGISNLLDESYFTYYAQAGTTRTDRYFAGRGRTLNITARFRF